MGTKEEKQKVLPLSYGVKIGLGKTVLSRLIQQNTNNKVVLDLDAVTNATNFINPTVVIDPHFEGSEKDVATLINKFNDTK